jgi:hypothetical protein
VRSKAKRKFLKAKAGRQPKTRIYVLTGRRKANDIHLRREKIDEKIAGAGSG